MNDPKRRLAVVPDLDPAEYTKDELMAVAEATGANAKEYESKATIADAVLAAVEELSDEAFEELVEAVLADPDSEEEPEELAEPVVDDGYVAPELPADYSPDLYELVTDSSGMLVEYRRTR